ncbi:MAG: DUF167 domain-containing protein [Thermoleophilia bacterium]
MLSPSPDGAGTLLKVRVIPGARKNQVAGEEGGRLKVRLQAPPLEGKANAALQKFLAASLGLKKNRIRLVSGQRSRDKLLLLEGVALDDALQVIKSTVERE